DAGLSNLLAAPIQRGTGPEAASDRPARHASLRGELLRPDPALLHEAHSDAGGLRERVRSGGAGRAPEMDSRSAGLRSALALAAAGGCRDESRDPRFPPAPRAADADHRRDSASHRGPETMNATDIGGVLAGVSTSG